MAPAATSSTPPACPASRSRTTSAGSGVRRRAAAALLAAAALSATGCAPDDDERPLRITFPSAPVTWDPHLHDEATTASVLLHAYEGLTQFDTDLRVRPALATTWDSPDELTWRFHLRPGVRFHDGSVMTAEDVAASLRRAQSHPDTRVATYLVAVREVRVVDSLTVELLTAQPAPMLPNRLPYVLVVPRNAPQRIVEPIGTGPYVLRSRTATTATFAAFPRYWGEQPDADSVELAFASDAATRLARLLGDSTDVLSIISAEEMPRVEAAACCDVRSRAALGVAYLGMNVTRAPLSDERVRQAISRAIDRQWIVDSVLRGLGRPTGQMVSPQTFGYDPSFPAPLRDTAEARRLLAAAGLPDGFTLEIAHSPVRTREVEAMARQLGSVGIRVRSRVLQFDSLYKLLNAGEVTAWLASVAALSGDAAHVFDAFVHSSDPATGYGTSNRTGYRDRTLDSLIEVGGRLVRMEERRSVFEAATRRAAAGLPYVPLWVSHRAYGARRDVTWTPRLDSRVLAQEMQRGR